MLRKLSLVILGGILVAIGVYSYNSYFNSEELGNFRTNNPIQLVTQTTSTGWSSAFLVQDFRNVVFQVNATTTPDMTLKFGCSVSDSAPTFSQSPGADNHWDYCETIDLEDGASLPGDTGLVIAAEDNRNLEMNTELIKWVAVQTSAYTSGTSTVRLKKGTNQ